ncbi:hypothetical protein PLICRDRAFT_58175 [Plicaturopsis crispa FD-325 SS-3]|uniref:Major facilitator superfamily (MFS) profile domain-containing protein n=1 Tax=Plicaturopsis crispa FD-325 SS-3 TaxID=944288 RepID=A0A0C9SWH7_PLICR|nr:hypothetical protein PLICRDRAFT_58175 [Plicaturopsis crispa FD-325 SS-3]
MSAVVRKSGAPSDADTIFEQDGSVRSVRIAAHPDPGPEKNTVDPYQVTFDENDPENPKSWSRAKRWYLTGLGGMFVLNATFASSAPSGIALDMIKEFHMSIEVGTLTIALFVAGYCVGPLVWGPLSEQYGRRIPFLISFFVYTLFQVGCALSKNTGSMLVLRFLGGTFAAAPLTNSGALMSDIWDADTRGKALALFSLAPFAGPALGPTVAGFISVRGVSWRWVFWVLALFAGTCWVAILLTLPETYAPTILVAKARRLRKDTGDARYYAPMERAPQVALRQRVSNILLRPFRIMFREPMLLAINTYLSFVYGCVYLLFEAFPIVFTRGHGFNAGVSGLMFLPIAVGGAFAVLGYLVIFNPRYERESKRRAPSPVPPEFRLEMTLFASPIFVVSFFWFAWTSAPTISFWAPLMAAGCMGFSISWIFLALLNYIVDAYLFVAASALASNTVLRSLAGAAFPLFATQMYDALGTQWASSLIGFVALALMPIPLVLIRYGPHLRQHSRYAPTKMMPASAVQPDAEAAEEAEAAEIAEERRERLGAEKSAV